MPGCRITGGQQLYRNNARFRVITLKERDDEDISSLGSERDLKVQLWLQGRWKEKMQGLVFHVCYGTAGDT